MILPVMQTDSLLDLDSLAAALAQAPHDGVPLPDDLDLVTAYDVQATAFALRGEPVAAWKVGLTSAFGQAAFGAHAPAAGRLGRGSLIASGMTVAATPGETFVEAELVVTIARDLPAATAPYSSADIAAAIGAVHAGIEITGTRFVHSDLPLGALIADNVMAERLVIGDRLADVWEPAFADMPASLAIGANVGATGSSAAVLGNPLRAVRWLANWLAAQNMSLRAGQHVSTGTCTGITEARRGDRVSVRFGDRGGASVQFTI